MTSCEVDSMTEGFLNPVMTKNNDELTNYTINDAEQTLICNASLVQSELGGDGHCCLGLILDPAKNNTVTDHALNMHPSPGALPVFPSESTQIVIAQITSTREE